jgi:hypothetical protein
MKLPSATSQKTLIFILDTVLGFGSMLTLVYMVPKPRRKKAP